MNRTVLRSLVVLSLAAPVAATTYEIDGSHSGVGFRVRHLVGKVNGRFEKFEGAFDFVEGKPEAWKAKATIDSASINTSNTKRDEHLRSADFFDVEKCPKIEFVSKAATKGKDDKWMLAGDLTMHCVTKAVNLMLEVDGTTTDPWGNDRVGVTATGKINRKDFGINYNKALDRGGMMLGDEVSLELNIEGIAKSDKGGDKAEKKSDKPAPKKGK